MEGGEGIGVGCDLSDTLTPSHITLAASKGGAVAANAEQRKHSKYSHLDRSLLFVPVAITTIGVLGPEANRFLHELAQRIVAVTNEPSPQFLLQRLAAAVQRGNAAAVRGSARVWNTAQICIFLSTVCFLIMFLYI